MIQVKHLYFFLSFGLIVVISSPPQLAASPYLPESQNVSSKSNAQKKLQRKVRLLNWIVKKIDQKQQRQKLKVEKWRNNNPKKYQRYLQRKARGGNNLLRGVFRWFFKILLYALIFALAALLGVTLAGAILGGIGWGILAAFGAAEGISFWTAVGTGAALALTTTITIAQLSR